MHTLQGNKPESKADWERTGRTNRAITGGVKARAREGGWRAEANLDGAREGGVRTKRAKGGGVTVFIVGVGGMGVEIVGVG